MKRLLLCFAALMFGAGVMAQNTTSYFMEGAPQRTQWNPAFAPDRGYVAIPLVGNLSLNTEGNITLEKFFFPQNGELVSLLSSSISQQAALGNLDPMNSLGLSTRLGIYNMGRYTKNKKNFWSVDVNLRVDVDANLPYELFEFLKTGNSTQFGGVELGAASYIEAGASYSFPINEKLYVGARAKALVGMARMTASIDNFTASLMEDRWYANAVGSVEMRGYVPATGVNEEGQPIYDMEETGSIKMPAGYGFGLDLGATYDVLPQLQISASVNDIGFMCWSAKNAAKGRIETGDMEYTGIEIDANGNQTQPEMEDFEDFDILVGEADGGTTAMRASINLGAEYSFLERKIGLGLLYNVRFREFKTEHNLVASANFRPLNWLHVSGSYAFVNNKASVVGLGLNFCTGFINLYLATDVLLSKKTPQFVPYKQSNMNITFGLAVPISKRGIRNDYKYASQE